MFLGPTTKTKQYGQQAFRFITPSQLNGMLCPGALGRRTVILSDLLSRCTSFILTCNFPSNLSLLGVCMHVCGWLHVCVCVCVCVCVHVARCNSLCFLQFGDVNCMLLSPQPLCCEHAYSCMEVFKCFINHHSFIHSFCI